ncbi:MAG: c-type cytochrome [Longimicrobiales bacterium]
MRSRFLSLFASSATLLLLTACGEAPPGVARGEALYDTCAPCHGDQGQGKEELGAPALAGGQQWFLAGQLVKFDEGARGYHYLDAGGLRMRPMRRALTSPEDVESVLAYIATMPAANPATTGIGNAAAGQGAFPVCTACHGVDGEGVEALNAPSLHHLSDWYVASSVQKYRDGVRGALPGDATGATMRPMVMSMTDDQIFNIAAYVQTLGEGGVPLTGDPSPTDPVVAGGEGGGMDVDASLLPEGVTVAMVEEGQAIFDGSGICFTCHVAGGVGGPLAPMLTDEVWLNVDGSYSAIVDLINTGVAQPLEHPGAMLPRAGMPLTDDQVAAVAAYVYMLSR